MNIDFTRQIEIQTKVLFESEYYTEGPVCGGEKEIYFTTLTGGKVWRWEVGKGAVPWVTCGWPNGQIRYEKGLVVCDSKNRRLARFDAAGFALTDIIQGMCGGKKIAVPNDVIADRDGGVYFTDSVRHVGCVFYVSASGVGRVVAQGLDYPNGLVLTEDGRSLVVAESYANRLVQISLDSPGIGRYVEVLCVLPRHDSGQPTANLPDGLALDKHGRIWVAHYGMAAIQVVDLYGRLLGTVTTGILLTSNLCFGGGNTVIVTGGDAEPGPGKLIKLTLSNK